MLRLFQKKTILNLGLIAAALHVLLGTLLYFFDLQTLWTVDYVVLGLLGTSAVVYFALDQTPIRLQKPQMLLIAFLIWYLFSCLSMTTTYHNDWVNYNREPMLNVFVALLLVFPLGYNAAREKRLPLGKILLYLAVLLWTAFIVWALAGVFQNRALPTANGGAIMMQNNALYLNCNPNTTGVLEMLFFLLCCFLALRARRVWQKTVFALCAPIHYAALVLSNSRTSVYASLIGFMLLAGITVCLLLKKSKKVVRLSAALAAALIAGAAFHLLRDQVYALYNACVQAASGVQAAADQAAAAPAQAAARDFLGNVNNPLTGRLTIWRGAWQGITSSPRSFFFGVTPPSVTSMISQATKSHREMYTHNQFLEIAAASGIPALFLFLAWFALICKDAYRLIFVNKDRSALLGIPALILTLVLANLTEATLLYYHFLSGYVFFFLCGYLHGAVNDPLQPKKLNRQALRQKARKKK